MAHSIRRRILFAAILLVSWGAQAPAARANQCQNSCGSGHHVCAMQARTAATACLQGCGADPTAAPCRAGCITTFRGARTACRAARGDCGSSCPAPLAAVDTPCAGTCSSTAQACFADTLSAGNACLQNCPAGTGLPDCWEQCAGDLRNSGATCLATLQGCLAACEGPVSGACFDTIALQCTVEACSPGQACSQPNEFCSPRCATPPPAGTCFDPSTMQCTQQRCSPAQPCAQANQSCVPECPPTPPKGRCFDTASKQCTDQPCAPGAGCGAPNLLCTLQCPPLFPTPPPQCSSVPCGGTCVISPQCPPNSPCPEIVSLLGQCALASTGACQCVPPSPGPTGTPPPTPTPQCTGGTCGGPCIVSLCPPGAVCPKPPCPLGAPCFIGMGQCEVSTTGACECVAVVPTPVATPTPQCTGTCAGPCTVSFPPFPCPAGEVCNGPAVSVVAGQCAMSATGGCECVPIVPTPEATPTPQCTGATCGGPCTIAFPPFPCPPDKVCNGPEVPVVAGQCEMGATGACACVPIPSPTQPPRPTATPQCAAVPCGGKCVIVPPCPPGAACHNFVIEGECGDDASGTCQCLPRSAPTPTPAPTCGTDADCNDDDACTVDHCVNGMCEHACICLTAAGAPACCPGPAALCARPCGADASGVCGGTCPAGATCDPLPNAAGGCGCVSGVGGPCGGFIVDPPVCAAGLVCQQSNPDVTGVCVVPKCIPLFTSGCSQTSDCCTPCGNGTSPPCGVCINGSCIGAP